MKKWAAFLLIEALWFCVMSNKKITNYYSRHNFILHFQHMCDTKLFTSFYDYIKHYLFIHLHSYMFPFYSLYFHTLNDDDEDDDDTEDIHLNGATTYSYHSQPTTNFSQFHHSSLYNALVSVINHKASGLCIADASIAARREEGGGVV